MKIRHFKTAKDEPEPLGEGPPLHPGVSPAPNAPSVFVDPDKRFQQIVGFGGAFTEAGAATLHKMSEADQRRVLDAYFDRAKGHGYSLCRTHINSCDFAIDNYAYGDEAGDFELKSFTIDRDRRHLLPFIHDGLKTASEEVKIFASPWSPPAWMKTNGSMNEGGKLKPECRQVWADYFVRYIREYEREGVKIWGVTVQNEPAAVQTWDSCIYSAEEERDFVRDYLGPTLAKAGLGHVKIIIWDHNRDLLIERARPIYSDRAASEYVWGTGFHWYGEDKFEHLELHHDAWPEKNLLFTEGCQEGGPHIGSWALGERYARSMINDFNRWCCGFVDWNLLLDETGGPNHVGNLCSAPIIADTKNNKLLFQNSYYYIGHFCRFVRPGAHRVLCATTVSRIEATAFANPDGAIAVIALNRTEEKQTINLRSPNWEAATELPPHSIATYVVEG